MTNSRLTTKAFHAELIAKRAKYLQKEEGCESMIIDSTSKLSGMDLAHSILEKKYLADEVSINQVTASRAEIETERQKLEEVKRLCDLASTAIKEIDVQIQQAVQSIALARRDFCIARRNELLREIKLDAKLRARIIEALAANAASGAGQYTFNTTLFIETFRSTLVPEISELEAREATDKFIKTNGL